jgi:hypothetical protein
MQTLVVRQRNETVSRTLLQTILQSLLVCVFDSDRGECRFSRPSLLHPGNVEISAEHPTIENNRAFTLLLVMDYVPIVIPVGNCF